MAKLKVVGGDIPKQNVSIKKQSIGQVIVFKTISGDTVQDAIDSAELITAKNKVEFGSAVGWGTVGALLAGPLGMAAGAILGGRGSKVWVAIKLVAGREFIVETDPATYAKLRSGSL